ncbi:hypothetical protein GALL_281010 [mine drainage metagenome]|uniref:Type 4 fimbrial biogenesis protein PilX N-terminal domain-containing protein n=1 Tax=mine drainage metagenome TaxID=410659 RepID=A0A1J5RKD9_9ZZZZ
MSAPMNSNRGSALVTVIILAGVMIILAGAALNWSLTERRLNNRSAYWLEARSAAEALAEYGFAQVRDQFDAQATPPTFKPGSGNELALPPTTFFSGSRVDTNTYSSTHLHGLELIGGPANTVPTTSMFYIDPSDPANEYDPMKGLWIVRRDITVLAKATVMPPTGQGPPITACVSETISVRGAPLFAHAIYYAKDDLEIFPGPQMDVYGPVHVNGNIFVSGQSSSAGLTFHGPVSATGGIFHAWANSNGASHGAGNETLGQNPVKFLSADGTKEISLNLTGTSSGWMDSTTGLDNGVSGLSNLQSLITQAVTTTFRQTAVQNWGGNLQTGAMGVQTYNPIAFNEVIGTDSSGNPVTADPHTLIEPPAPPSSSDPYYSAKEQIEQQKYSTQAQLYVKVTLSSPTAGTAPTATIQLYGPSTGSAGTGPNDYVPLGNPTNMGGSGTPLVTYQPYIATQTTVGSKVSSGTNKGKYPITTTTITSAGAGAATTTYSSTLPSKASGGTISSGGSDVSVSSGLYDQRRQMGVDIVQVDMKALGAAVSDMVSNTSDANAITNPDGSVFNSWNGAVYVEINDTSPRGDTSSQSASVRLVDGQVSSGSSLMPSYGVNGKGLTIATNAPLYIQGNFNADGSVSSASATTPDDGNSGSPSDPTAESPVCVAADAITILSSNWKDKISADTVKPTPSSSTEIAAAFLTGLVPTSNSASSGGAHNFPRFLENGGTVAIRGSLVAMFESKIATQPWAISYYGAPVRIWGFDSLFQNGTFPPLTPKVQSFRRSAFSLMSQSDYDAAKAALWP